MAASASSAAVLSTAVLVVVVDFAALVCALAGCFFSVVFFDDFSGAFLVVFFSTGDLAPESVASFTTAFVPAAAVSTADTVSLKVRTVSSFGAAVSFAFSAGAFFEAELDVVLRIVFFVCAIVKSPLCFFESQILQYAL